MKKHCLSISDFSKSQIDALFEDTKTLSSQPKETIHALLRHKVSGSLFYQTSTRTRLSFDAAMAHLGGKTIGFSDFKQTRAGDFFTESLEDTVRIVAGMVDVIIVRHFDDGAAATAASLVDIPVINAGDGANEHPTQALCDLWSLHKRLGDIFGLCIAMVGDPACRALRSMLIALCQCSVGRIIFLCPPNSALSDAQKQLLASTNVPWTIVESIDDAVSDADVVWMIPFLLPNFHDAYPSQHDRSSLASRFRLTSKVLYSVKKQPLIVHTGPRGEELDTRLDDVPHCLYFKQAQDAVELRMALLASILVPEWKQMI